MATYLLLLCSLLRNALRSRHDLLLENLALRHQLSVLSRQKQRPRLQPADRLFWSGLWGAKTPSVSVEVSLSVAPAQ